MDTTYIKTKLAADPKAVAWALTALAARQTTQEYEAEVTHEKNGQGFNGVDAEILTSFAKQVKRGRTLSEKQLAIARRKLPKYAKQILQAVLIAKGEA